MTIRHSTVLSLTLWLREETLLEPVLVALAIHLLMNLLHTPMSPGLYQWLTPARIRMAPSFSLLCSPVNAKV